MRPLPSILWTLLPVATCAAWSAARQEVIPTSPAPAEPKAALAEVFPGVRADRVAHAVEFDAEVIADVRDPAKKLYPEVLACPQGTKEHESLVMTKVKPSQVHAALLLAGFNAGAPAKWRREDGKSVATPPTGDKVEVRFIWSAGPPSAPVHADAPLTWVKNAKDGKKASEASSGFVFAGSTLVKRADGAERYDADSDGSLIGLASFGTETIAWVTTFSPEASVDEPVWIADPSAVPAVGTKVTVRITRPE